MIPWRDLDAGPGDLVAVAVTPGAEWLPIVRHLWSAGAAILPLDDRLGVGEAGAILGRARPTWLLDPAGARALPNGRRVDEGIGVCISTSGTGGAPKLVELSRAALEFAVHASIGLLGGEADDPWLCCLPVAHIGGLLVVLRGAILGAPVKIVPRFDPAAFGATARRPFTAMVPTMLHRLLGAGFDLTRFRAILVGGAAASETDIERARSGGRLVTTYGLTETCGGFVYEGMPFEGTSVRFGPDAEIQVAGPHVMERYRSDAHATDRAFTVDGWLRTGDAGERDEQGTFRVCGRLDEAILSGGEKIWPQEVEAVLRNHPQVADVAVAGQPDEEWGALVVAYVVPRPGFVPPGVRELRDFASERIARFKAPRDVVFVESLPRTASGKVRKEALPMGSTKWKGPSPGG